MTHKKIRRGTHETWAALTADCAVHFFDFVEGDWWWLPGDGSWAYQFEPLVRHFFRPGLTAEVGEPIELDVIFGSLEPPLVESMAMTPPVVELLRFPAASGVFFDCLEGWNPFANRLPSGGSE